MPAFLRKKLASGIPAATGSARGADEGCSVQAGDIEYDLLRANNWKYLLQMICLGSFWTCFGLIGWLSGARALVRCACWGVAVGLFIGVSIVAMDTQDRQRMVWISGVLDHIFTVVVLCFSYALLSAEDDEAGCIFLRGFATIAIPVSRAKQAANFQEFVLYGVCVLCITAVAFRDDMAGQGWQWLLLSFLCMFIVAFNVQQRLDAKAAAQTVNLTYAAIQRLLSMMSDGVLLLDDEGCIVGVDMKAGHLLGVDARAPWEPVPLANFFRSALKGPELRKQFLTPCALLNLQLHSSTGEVLEVEAYNVSCLVKASCASLLLGHKGAGAPSGRSSTHYCAIRVRQLAADAVSNAHGRSCGSDEDVAFDADADSPGLQKCEAEKMSSFSTCLPLEDTVITSEVDGLSAVSEALEVNSVVAGMEPRPLFGDSPLKLVPALGIGNGEYTMLRKVRHTALTTIMQVRGPDGNTYALKRIKVIGTLWQRDFPRNLRNLDREVRSLKSLSWADSVIVRLVDSWLEADFNFACIVMEWVPHTLETVFSERSREGLGPLSLETTQRYTAQLAVGLAVVHYAKLMHRDLKPSNVLLTDDGKNVKIADLGVSRQAVLQGLAHERTDARSYKSMDLGSVMEEVESCDSISVATGYTRNVGTRAYASPECLRSGLYDEMTDMFSLGCVLFELLTLESIKGLRESPDVEVAERSLQQAAGRRLQAAGEPPPGCAPDLYQGLHSACLGLLQVAPGDRPRASELARLPVLSHQVEALVQEHPALLRALDSGIEV